MKKKCFKFRNEDQSNLTNDDEICILSCIFLAAIYYLFVAYLHNMLNWINCNLTLSVSLPCYVLFSWTIQYSSRKLIKS